MAFQDRRYDEPDDGGRFRKALRRIFVEGDNFFGWALPLFTVAGIRVRIHLLFVLMIAVELIMSIPHGATGVEFRAMLLGCLFVMVLLHEFGHCLACRWVGGEAGEVLLWPLGGLAMCVPPHTWRANLITTAGGPLVNILLAPVFAGLMLLAGARPVQLVFNPFDPWHELVVLGWGSWWKIAVFFCHYTNLVLLLFNLLVPMFPMDGARMVQELLWRRLGWRRSMEIAVNVGLVTAVTVGLVSIVTPDTQRLFGLAVFGGFICFQQRQQLRMTADEPGYDPGRPSEYGYGPAAPRAAAPSPITAPPDPAYRAALKKQQREQLEQAELDRILGKIAATGMASLTRAERRALEEATHRRRGDAP